MSDRIDPKIGMVGKGLGASPERVRELQARMEKVRRVTGPKPTRRFSHLVQAQGQGGAVIPVTEKEKKKRELPKKGPRPSLAHPSQRQTYGREGSDEDVVVKG